MKAVTGRLDVVVGDALESCTDHIRVVACAHPHIPGRNLVLVDTQGFDDSNKCDSEVLEGIANWLART